MGRMLGSDPDQLDGLGDTLTRSADRLNAIGGEVSSLLAYAGWEGGDADEFRWQWHHQLTGILHATAAQNHEAARVLRINAHEQRAASEGYASPGFPGQHGNPPVRGGSGIPFGDGWELVGLFSTFITGNSVLASAFQALGAPESMKTLAGAVKGLDHFLKGPALIFGLPSMLNDAYVFGAGLGSGDSSPETVNAGVDTVFNVVELSLLAGTIVCPPAAPVLGAVLGVTTAAHFAFDAVVAIDPTLPSQIADGMSDFADSAVDSVGDVADAVTGVVSGGVDAVTNFFGF